MVPINVSLSNESEKSEKKYEAKSEVLAWIRSLALSVLVVLLLVTFVGTVVQVSGDSMNPTLVDGDRLIINRFSKDYKVGDIVAINREKGETKLVKRIIATQGQRVNIDYEKGEVYVNEQLVDEPFILEPTLTNLGVTMPVLVPVGAVFVMGDNRNNSEDSRSPTIGMINVENIMGKVAFRVFPFDKFGSVKL